MRFLCRWSGIPLESTEDWLIMAQDYCSTDMNDINSVASVYSHWVDAVRSIVQGTGSDNSNLGLFMEAYTHASAKVCLYKHNPP